MSYLKNYIEKFFGQNKDCPPSGLNKQETSETNCSDATKV